MKVTDGVFTLEDHEVVALRIAASVLVGQTHGDPEAALRDCIEWYVNNGDKVVQYTGATLKLRVGSYRVSYKGTPTRLRPRGPGWSK